MLEFIINNLKYIEWFHHIIKIFFLKHIPNIAGEYIVRYENEASQDAETVDAKQFLSYVYGDLTPFDVGKKYYFFGKIYPTRLISYKFWPIDPNLHDFGVGFLKIVSHPDVTYFAEGYSIDIDEKVQLYTRKFFLIKK